MITLLSDSSGIYKIFKVSYDLMQVLRKSIPFIHEKEYEHEVYINLQTFLPVAEKHRSINGF